MVPRPAGANELRRPAAGRSGPGSPPGGNHPTVVCDDAPPYRGLEVRAEARLIPLDDRSVVSRIAGRYLGSEAGEEHAESGHDDLLIRLEPGELRGWDFADVYT